MTGAVLEGIGLTVAAGAMSGNCIRVEGFNLLNHPVLGYPNADFSNAQNFGTVTTTASTQRQLQLAAKFIF